MDSVEPMYSVDASTPQKKADNIYEICYRITRDKHSKRKIVRVELAVGGEVLMGKVGDRLEQGCFVFDMNKHPDLVVTDITYNVLAWDDSFNCVASIERFIQQI